MVNVSIPAGFSDALRQGDQIMMKDETFVSIPAGFSDALRLKKGDTVTVFLPEFQSLLGFLMRCDLSKGSMRKAMNGFNPCWVF